MPTNFTFDHVIIAVNDLDHAMQDYGDLGFTVFFGGRHATGTTHNALIVFADGSYLELLAPTGDQPTDVRAADYLAFWEAGEGLAGYALHSKDLASAITIMRAWSVPVSDLISGSRARPDDREIHWRTATVNGLMSPFFIEDMTPRELRVPNTDAEKARHPNGVIGVAEIVVAVADLDEAIQRYRGMTGSDPQKGTPIVGAETATLVREHYRITLAAPTGPDSPLTAYLSQRGESPYLLKLRTKDEAFAGLLDLTQTHGARIELTTEP